MDTEIDTTSNSFFDCSSHFYERKNLKYIGVPITSLVIVYFCNDCGSFSSLFNRIHSIRKRKKRLSFFFVSLVWKYSGKLITDYISRLFLPYDFSLPEDNNEEVHGVSWEGIQRNQRVNKPKQFTFDECPDMQFTWFS